MSDKIFSRLISNQLFPKLTWLRFVGFEFWMVGFVPFFIAYVVSSEKLYDFNLFYGFLIIALLTSSTFVLNHICDLELDRKNPRKEFSLLVRGTLSVPQSWVLFWILQLSPINTLFPILRNNLSQINNTLTITPLIVIPSKHFNHIVSNRHC